MSGYVITWGGVASSTIPEVIIKKVWRGMTGEIRDQPVPIPGRDGSYLFPERRGDRIIRAEGVVVASPTTRHAAVVELADWYDQSGVGDLLIHDQTDRLWLASVKVNPDPDEWKSTGKFVLEWRADPYALDVTTTSECATATSGSSEDITLPGDVPADVVVEITPLNGTITNFELTVGDGTLEYTGTINSGQTVTINGLVFTVTSGANNDLSLTGAYTPGTVFSGSVAGDFPFLQPGVNDWSIIWTGTATQTRVCFTYRRRFR